MAVDRITYIKDKYNVLDYASNVLGLPVRRSGDRCVSLAPNSKNPTAMIVYDDWWYDFKLSMGGDVIDLCAVAKFNGDRGAAIRELAGDYGVNYEWVQYTQKLCNKIAYWQTQLRECDYRYLRSRRIYKNTVERLRLGYDPNSDRLIIPYFKNGYVTYYIGRDRSGKAGVSKYKKAFLDGFNENTPWGLQTFEANYQAQVLKALESTHFRKADEGGAPVEENRAWESSTTTGEKSPKIDPEAQKKSILRNSTEIKKILDEYVVIAEGAFDAMSFEQQGFKVLSPISGYFNKEALKQVISLCKTVKKVLVVFDNDSAGSRFTINMCMALFRNRIPFVCGSLQKDFKDVSEFYASGGDLFDIVDNAVSGISVLGGKITDKDEFRKFVYEAARYVDKTDIVDFIENTNQFSAKWLDVLLKESLKAPVESVVIREIKEKYTLKYLEEIGFYEYRHGVWIKRPDNVIKGYFAELLGHWAQGSKLETLLRYLKAEITTEELMNRKPIFNFRNVILDLETGQTREHSPSDMSSIQMNYDYDESADCPKWKKFIAEIMLNDEKKIQLLQEMAGYILFTDCSLQKCFFLIGDGSNGKSVFLNVLTAVFNKENVSNVEMSSLIEPFQRIGLLNSLVNITTETATNVKGAESIFKQVVAGDEINGCFKNKDFVKFTPRCKVITACNEFIKSRDTTHAFMRRIIFVKFLNTFEGKRKDRNLESKLKTELPGIFNWVCEGFRTLRSNGEFTQTAEQNELLDEFIKIMNPVAAFIREDLCSYVGNIERSDLYVRYCAWVKEAGHEKQSRNKFMQSFRKTCPRILPYVREWKSGSNRYFEFEPGNTPSYATLEADEDYVSLNGQSN